ncbi:MAG: type II secretion system protein GspD, partial [Caldilineae bacterium]
NILIVVGQPQMINEVSSVVESLDVAPETDAGRLRVYYLKYADAEETAKVINDLVSGNVGGSKQSPGKQLFTGDVKVVADKTTNALLITADTGDIPGVERIIRKLDIRRRQVLVEALIVEVSADMAQQFGIEWQAAATPTDTRVTPLGGTSFSSSTGTSIQSVSADPLAAAGGGLVVGAVNGTVTLNGVEYLNLAALARALETQADTNVLSTPNLLTLDNEEAEIIVGQNVPFITGSAQTQGGTANPFQTIERKDIGLTLRVKPQISEGDTVRLELYQEISSIDTAATGQGADLITNKRSIKTVVLANDQQMIVLGGLMRDDATSGVQRVPCLGAVPVLGEAFKFTDNLHRKTNLMIFLRPHIISSDSDIDAITSGKYQDIKKLYERNVAGGTILFPRQQKRMPEDLQPNLKLDEKVGAGPASEAPKQAD